MAARQACDRAEIDDRAAAVPDHFGNRVFRHQHHGGDVDAHRAVPGVGINLDGVAARPGDADIVHQNVQPAPRRDGARDDRLTRGRIADVAFDGLRNAAFRRDQPRGFLRPLRNRIHQRDPRAVPRQNDRGSAAVSDALGARAGAGDDGDLALEPVVAANGCHVSSEHAVGVGGLFRNFLRHVPVLDNLAVLELEDVDDGPTAAALLAHT